MENRGGAMKQTKKELSQCCNELKIIRNKYANKRTGYTSLPFIVLRKKYKLFIPRKYLNGKEPIFRKLICLIKQRAYLMGKLEVMRGKNGK